MHGSMNIKLLFSVCWDWIQICWADTM